MPKHEHAEAFRLMQYRSRDGLEVEWIWNSRDGVTPFVIVSRSGKEMIHVDWANDLYRPDYRPNEGERMFIDMTPEIAKSIAKSQVEKYWNDPRTPMREMFSSEEEAVQSLMKQYSDPPGQPYLYP